VRQSRRKMSGSFSAALSVTSVYLRKIYGECGSPNLSSYKPTINYSSPQTSHLFALEICCYVAFIICLLIGMLNKKLGTIVGLCGLGLVMETLMYFFRAQANNTFFIQVACFIPLKSILWYVIAILPGICAAQSARGGKGGFYTAMLSAGLTFLQILPYEMIKSLDFIDDTYVNELDFQFGRLNERFNTASVLVLITFFIVALSASYVSFALPESINVIAIPLLTPLLSLVFFLPYDGMKVLGCIPYFKSEPTVSKFYNRCVNHSHVKDISIFFLGSVFALLCILYVFQKQGKATTMTVKPVSLFQQLLYFTSALLLHVCFIVILVKRSTFTTLELYEQVIIYVSIVFAHLGLLYLSLNPSSDGQSSADTKVAKSTKRE
jgi:hypothetical protein